MTDGEMRKVLELALLTSQSGPLSARALARMFADADIGEKRVRAALGDLTREWENRALELRETAGGFQFVSRGGGMEYLRRLSPRKPPRLSRPLTEILAFIAYRQPATRGDIEQVRGAAVSSQQIATLEEFGWIEEVGRRQTPGRPALYATTKTFLDDLGLAKLEDLPAPEALAESADAENDSDPESPAADSENGAASDSPSVSASSSASDSLSASNSPSVSASPTPSADSNNESDSASVDSENESDSGSNRAAAQEATEDHGNERPRH